MKTFYSSGVEVSKGIGVLAALMAIAVFAPFRLDFTGDAAGCLRVDVPLAAMIASLWTCEATTPDDCSQELRLSPYRLPLLRSILHLPESASALDIVRVLKARAAGLSDDASWDEVRRVTSRLESQSEALVHGIDLDIDDRSLSEKILEAHQAAPDSVSEAETSLSFERKFCAAAAKRFNLVDNLTFEQAQGLWEAARWSDARQGVLRILKLPQTTTDKELRAAANRLCHALGSANPCLPRGSCCAVDRTGWDVMVSAWGAEAAGSSRANLNQKGLVGAPVLPCAPGIATPAHEQAYNCTYASVQKFLKLKR